MAIIIVAMILFFIVLGSYVVNRIDLLRRREREFYDIYAIMQFFQVIRNVMEWDVFLQMAESITVIRRKVTQHDLITKREEYVCYDFCFDKETYSIYQRIRPIHQKRLRLVLRDSFRCIVDSQKIKMTFQNSLEQNIFISSYDMALEMLYLLLEQKRKEFQGDYGWLKNWFNEVDETIQMNQNKTLE